MLKCEVIWKTIPQAPLMIVTQSRVIGQNMVMIDCFSWGETLEHNLFVKILDYFTSGPEMCTSHTKCSFDTSMDFPVVLFIIISSLGLGTKSNIHL